MRTPALITPSVMEWARKTAGMSVEDAVECLVAKNVAKSITPEIVKGWETGKGAPTYRQLEKVAAIYHRPLIVFYLPKPPEEDDIKSEFEFFPKAQAELLPHQIRFLVRSADNFRLNLYELQRGGQNPAVKKIFDDIRFSASHDTKRAAAKVRRYLNLGDPQQYKNDDAAFEARRQSIEEHGVSVFKESFKYNDCSGFCLYDRQFPIIYINNDLPTAQQSFALFYQLALILMKKSGIRFRGKQADAAEELTCAIFAGETLAPEADIKKIVSKDTIFTNKVMELLTAQYSVSQEVILRQLLNVDLINQKLFDKMNTQLQKEQESKKQRQGPANYAVRVYSYLSKIYIQAAYDKYHHGRIDECQLADYLNTKVRYLDIIARYLLRDTKID